MIFQFFTFLNIMCFQDSDVMWEPYLHEKILCPIASERLAIASLFILNIILCCDL